MNITPDMNTGANYFVFGSNESGIHGAGAAREALLHWGAIFKVGMGPMGHCYAIPTKDWNLRTLPLETIAFYVRRFLAHAANCPEKTFLVTALGTGLAGYDHEDIAPLFKSAPSNCVLPDEWKGLL